MEILENYKGQKYTMKWLGLQTLFILLFALILAALVGGVDNYAAERQETGLLTEASCTLVASSTTYCFAVIAITLLSLVLIELAFRKSIQPLQYALIGCALALFHLLLLAMAEHMPFWLAYAVVSIMTIGLIVWFVAQIMQTKKPISLTALILLAEYALMLVLIYMGSFALLIGSLSLFVLIAVAMYFTLKLKIENDELVIK